MAGSGRRRRQDDGGGGVEKLAPVVFADSEDVETDLVGVFDLLEQIAHAGDRAEGDTCSGVWKYRCEAVNADLHKCNRYTPQQTLRLTAQSERRGERPLMFSAAC